MTLVPASSSAERSTRSISRRSSMRLGDQRFRVTLAQRQLPQRKVAQHLNANAAQPEREREAKIRIARDTGEHLDPIRNHLLHEIAGDRPVKRSDAALHLVIG